MIRYYFKIALRKLWRNKQSSLFNIFGLCIGIACCILIALFIYDDLGYDASYYHSKDTFRLITEVSNNESVQFSDHTPAPLKIVLKDEIPEINNIVRFTGVQEYTSLNYQNKEFRNPGILLTDPEVFDLFGFKVIKGNTKSLLTELNSIVITKSFAKKLFANDEPLGKIIFMKGDFNSNFIVSGVIEDMPLKSSIKFNALCSFQLLNENRWGIWNFTTFIKLREHTGSKNTELKFRMIENRYLNSSEEKVRLHLQAISKIHLDLNPFNKFPTTVDNKPIFIYSLIGLLILLIACFNYIILSTSQASKRNAEVGIQKVLGSSRSQLIIQYLTESIIITLIAAYFGVLLAENYVPVLNELSGKQIAIHYNNGFSYFVLGLFALLIGILSGLYPALFLSALKPIGIFRYEIYRGYRVKNFLFREFLVLIQFVISIILIISTITIQKQLAFIKARDLGIDYHNILVLPIHQKEVKEKCAMFRENLLRNPKIVKVSATSYLPGEWGYCQNTWWEGMPPNDKSAMMDWMSVDTSFLEVLKIKMLHGNEFTNSDQNPRQYILNKTAVKTIGWNNPIGKSIDIVGMGEVVGVVEDFNFKSLHTPVRPMALCIMPELYEYLYIKLQPGTISLSVQIIENEWKRLFPNIEFSYSYLDNDILRNYNAENRSGRLINYFAFIAIILSCLGIYSLVSYTILQRTREMGLRKVSGATTPDLMLMLSGNFTKWVVIAFIIACPIAYYVMNNWLQNFAYRTSFSWWIFLLAGSITFIIALVTTSWQSWKAANKNPVEALRYE
jgi:putative ABC transport system permease protein